MRARSLAATQRITEEEGKKLALRKNENNSTHFIKVFSKMITTTTTNVKKVEATSAIKTMLTMTSKRARALSSRRRRQVNKSKIIKKTMNHNEEPEMAPPIINTINRVLPNGHERLTFEQQVEDEEVARSEKRNCHNHNLLLNEFRQTRRAHNKFNKNNNNDANNIHKYQHIDCFGGGGSSKWPKRLLPIRQRRLALVMLFLVAICALDSSSSQVVTRTRNNNMNNNEQSLRLIQNVADIELTRRTLQRRDATDVVASLVTPGGSAAASAQAPATCGYPGSPAHASVTFNTSHVQAGTAAAYTCDNGYELLGPPRRICQTNGTWSPVGIPFCGK